MALFDNFPWTNFHDLNLDWILQSIKSIASDVAQLQDDVEELDETKQNLLTFDDTPTDGSDNPVTSDGIYDALAEKQDVLSFDLVPTAGSSNPVYSYAIYNAIESIKSLITRGYFEINLTDEDTRSGASYTYGQAVDYSDGTIYTDDIAYTVMFPVTPGDSIAWRMGYSDGTYASSYGMCFLDSSASYISGTVGSGNTVSSITVPSGAATAVCTIGYGQSDYDPMLYYYYGLLRH